MDYNRLHQNANSGPQGTQQPDTNTIIAEDNAMNCSSSSPRDRMVGDWGIASRNGRLGIFRNGPAMPYQSAAAGWQDVPVEQILYERD